MITIKSYADLQQLPINHPALPILSELFDTLYRAYTGEGYDYNPDYYGFVALVEAGDTHRLLQDLDMPYRLSRVPWEGVTRMGDYFHAVYLANDDFGIGFLIPDAPWVQGKLRESLLENLDP